MERKLVKARSGLKYVEIHSEQDDPFILREPEWSPDADRCMKCNGKFTMMRRRHHCRRCGLCLCTSCCFHVIPLPRMSFVDPVRVCDPCAQQTYSEADIFDRCLALLANGASVSIEEATEIPNANQLPAFVQLSTNRRLICISFRDASAAVSIDIPLRTVAGFQVFLAKDQSAGLSLDYQTLHGETALMKVASVSRESREWLLALQRSLKMILADKQS